MTNLRSCAISARFFLSVLIAVGMAAGTSGLSSEASAKAVKKRVLTEAQKKELRKKGREWCMKNHVIGGGAFIVRVEIMNDGRVRCWFKS